ncbi:MAG: glycosyltransferase [Ruminiclostridium sp.]|nr:glycosyltransferase [Ruminiclostridium sp.]
MEPYLKRCLDSILDNTYKNLEVLCIDNGSTDESMNILKYYNKMDKRVKILNQSVKGPSATRNMGLDNAKGEYISFVDSDDFVSYNAYEILIEVAQKHDLDLIMFGANCVPYENTPNWMWPIINTQYRYYKDCKGSKIVFKERASRPFLWMHFIKRELFEKPTKIRFDETMMLAEDHLLQFQYVPRAKNIMVIDDKLYNYQIARGGSLMQLYSSRRIKKVETHITLIEKLLECWEYDGEFWEEESELITWTVNFLYYSIIDLPMAWKQKYSKRIVKLLQENFTMSLIADWERQHYAEMMEWSEIIEIVPYAEELTEMMENDKYQIREILKSKAFKIGRMMTKKKERLNLDEYKEYIK